MPIDAPVDLETDPAVEPFAGQGGGADAPQFPTLGKALVRRSQDPRAMALRERRAADTDHIADRRFAVDAQKLELDKIHFLTELQKEEAAVHQAFETNRQKQAVMKGLTAIKPGDDYSAKVLELAAEHPQAMTDPYIQHHIKTNLDAQTAKAKFSSDLDLFRQKQDMELAAKRTWADEEDARAEKLRNAPENSGMKPEQMTARGSGGSVTLGKSKVGVIDPYKESQHIYRQINTHLARGREIDAQLKSVDESTQKPKWLNSTGIFKDAKGEEYFGYAEGGNDKATPAEKQRFIQYQNALTEKTAISKKIPELQTKMDSLMSGDDAFGAAPATPPASPAAEPDLATLAKQALDDPSASEAHKAAAKKILGL